MLRSLFRLLLKATIVCSFFILGMFLHHQMDKFSTFPYENCSSMDEFADAAVKHSAVMLANGLSPDGVISMWLLPDGSIGMYIYLEPRDQVCMITWGDIANPAVDPSAAYDTPA